MQTSPTGVPSRRHRPDDSPIPGLMQLRVQYVLLRQLADAGAANQVVTSMMVPGTDERDLEVALENLFNAGSIEGPATLEPLIDLAAAGRLTLTPVGLRRLDEDT